MAQVLGQSPRMVELDDIALCAVCVGANPGDESKAWPADFDSQAQVNYVHPARHTWTTRCCVCGRLAVDPSIWTLLHFLWSWFGPNNDYVGSAVSCGPQGTSIRSV